MTFKLRYYAPRLKPLPFVPISEELKRIVRLLKLIRNKHEIGYEIIDLSMGNGSFPAEMIGERLAYEREFLPRAKILKERVGTGLSSVFKQYMHPNLAGTIAITRDGDIEWYAIPRIDI